MILRGLNKGQKKEIYFCNKAKIFSSFLLILMHVFRLLNLALFLSPFLPAVDASRVVAESKG